MVLIVGYEMNDYAFLSELNWFFIQHARVLGLLGGAGRCYRASELNRYRRRFSAKILWENDLVVF